MAILIVLYFYIEGTTEILWRRTCKKPIIVYEGSSNEITGKTSRIRKTKNWIERNNTLWKLWCSICIKRASNNTIDRGNIFLVKSLTYKESSWFSGHWFIWNSTNGFFSLQKRPSSQRFLKCAFIYRYSNYLISKMNFVHKDDISFFELIALWILGSRKRTQKIIKENKDSFHSLNNIDSSGIHK